jgi:hypothetical protein
VLGIIVCSGSNWLWTGSGSRGPLGARHIIGGNVNASNWPPSRRAAALALLLAPVLLAAGCAEGVPSGNATPQTWVLPAPAETPVPSAPADTTSPSGQASGAPVQVITIPLGKQTDYVEAKLPINGYFAPPGAEITYDASESVGVVVKYEWDLDGDGSYDRTTADPVLRHTYRAEFEGLMILRVTGIAGGTDTLETPVRIRTTPRRQWLAAPSNVRIEVLSTVGGISEVKVSWESNDPGVYRWGVTLDGFPAGIVEGSTRSVNVTEVHREKDVLIEILGFTADGAMGDRAGTVLAAE